MATGTAGRDSLIAEFWLHYRLATGDRAERLTADEHFWAWEAVDDLMAEGGTEAVALIVDLAEVVAGDDPALCYLGSGPVEALLGSNSTSREAIEALERAAVDLPSVRTAVRCVWWGDGADKDLVERFNRFGPTL